MKIRHLMLSIMLVFVGKAVPAVAQTCQWSPLGSGTSSEVFALTVFDDGTGPALYAGGNFTMAGGVPANFVAKWDGAQWAPLGSGISGNGVLALTVFDDGTGPALYAGGTFTTAGGASANHIAKWDGARWAPLGNGVTGGGPYAHGVAALTVFDDGTGPALYAGGRFWTSGDVPANSIAKWDGAAWAPLGNGVSDGATFGMFVVALTVFDDGTGPALYAGGTFGTAGDVTVHSVAKWDGTQWAPLMSAGGVSGWVYALTGFDSGTGPALYLGGNFLSAGSDGTGWIDAHDVAKWDGARFAPLGSGVGSVNCRPDCWAYALTGFDDGTGSAVYAGGFFTTAGGVPANDVARWDDTQWAPLGNGLTGGDFTDVRTLVVFDDGTGPALYAGGSFGTAGGVAANNIAKWTCQ